MGAVLQATGQGYLLMCPGMQAFHTGLLIQIQLELIAAGPQH